MDKLMGGLGGAVGNAMGNDGIAACVGQKAGEFVESQVENILNKSKSGGDGGEEKAQEEGGGGGLDIGALKSVCGSNDGGGGAADMAKNALGGLFG